MPDHDEGNAAESTEPGVASEASGPTPGGPATVAATDPQEATLAEELVQESHGTTEALGEISPDTGTIRPDPGAGGSRFDELVGKRKSIGLSDEESEELGRLMAQRDGREWTSTREMKDHPADTT